MRYAILADIHSNLTAFEAVLGDIEERGGADQIWSLGDVVGYGPDPGECLGLLRKYEHLCVAGNHDWASVGSVGLEEFNPDAAAACRWTAGQLSVEQAEYLENLPLILRMGDFTLAHGSPREPIWEYLLSTHAAKVSFGWFQSRFCLVGHSHIPLLFEYDGDSGGCTMRELSTSEPLELGDRRLIINPGAVGQPRDGDPRAAYAIYDSDAGLLWHYRVPYDVAETQQRMGRVGLPPALSARLLYGW